eukprot:scpid26912/ scgid15747/ 
MKNRHILKVTSACTISKMLSESLLPKVTGWGLCWLQVDVGAQEEMDYFCDWLGVWRDGLGVGISGWMMNLLLSLAMSCLVEIGWNDDAMVLVLASWFGHCFLLDWRIVWRLRYFGLKVMNVAPKNGSWN